MVTSLILTGATVLAMNSQPVTLGTNVRVQVAPQFCEGIRSANEQKSWTYKDWLAEYALDLAAAAKIEEQAILDALKEPGMTPENAAVRGVMIRARAKALMAAKHSPLVQNGQKNLCGRISNNW